MPDPPALLRRRAPRPAAATAATADAATAPEHRPPQPLRTRDRTRLFTLPLIANLAQFVLLLTLLSLRLWRPLPGDCPIPAVTAPTVAHAPPQNHSPPPSPSPSALYDVFVTIYAYDRPRHLLDLLRDVRREAHRASLRVGVHVLDDNSFACVSPVADPFAYDDGADTSRVLDPHRHLLRVPHNSTLPCTAAARFRRVVAFLHEQGWPLYISRVRRARRRYWFLVRLAHALLRDVQAKYYVFLPDDDRLADDFFGRVSQLWESVQDTRKMTMMLHVEATREGVPVWTNFKPRDVGGGVWRVGWVESGNFICDQRLLHFLNWSFPAVPVQRWRDNPNISSGVGATLSELLHANGKRMYQTKMSFVAHMGVTMSKMNAEFRDRHAAALLTRRFADGDERYKQMLGAAASVTASIASHWVRDAALHAAVHSLAHQVDHVNVYLNSYDSIPPFLYAPYITVLQSQDPRAKGDIGDIGKFFWANQVETDLHLTADDDIVYPPDYVDKLVAFWQGYKAPLAVGVHGIRIKHDDLNPTSRRRGKGYYGSREVWMAVENVSDPVNVHIIGTGTMLYSPTDIGDIDIENVFREPNMADIWFGLLAQKHRLPMMIIPHSEGWIREVPGTFEDSIYKRSTRSRSADRLQTKAAQSIPEWKLHEATRR